MRATNLDLVGESRWGQMVSKRIYSDSSGRMCVMERKIGTLRRKVVPYRQFANDFMRYSYILERKA